MINSYRQQIYKIAKLKQYTEIKVYNTFTELNKEYKQGVITGAFDWQSKYFVDEKIRPNILNVNMIDFAKNKYRSYKEIEKLGIPQLKTVVMNNPKYNSVYRGIKDVEKTFGDSKFVIKPNDAGLGHRIFLTDSKKVENLCINDMWDEYILCQEYIENYQDMRIVILEPNGIIDAFQRVPSNLIGKSRDYSCREEVIINEKLKAYINKIRQYILKNYKSKYMFYSIDFYIKNGKVIFGEINNNIGIHLVSEKAIKEVCNM